MTVRAFSRSRALRLQLGWGVGLVAALALLVPLQVNAQGTEFRSTISIAGGPVVPLNRARPFNDPGSVYVASIAVGDDFSTVGFSLGSTFFGASPFERRGASLSQFELRADCTPRAPAPISPYLRVAAGAYGVDTDRSQDQGTSRRLGVSTGVGLRWAPAWHSAITLVATYYNMPARAEPPRQWIAVTLELLRWMD